MKKLIFSSIAFLVAAFLVTELDTDVQAFTRSTALSRRYSVETSDPALQRGETIYLRAGDGSPHELVYAWIFNADDPESEDFYAGYPENGVISITIPEHATPGRYRIGILQFGNESEPDGARFYDPSALLAERDLDSAIRLAGIELDVL